MLEQELDKTGRHSAESEGAHDIQDQVNFVSLAEDGFSLFDKYKLDRSFNENANDSDDDLNILHDELSQLNLDGFSKASLRSLLLADKSGFALAREFTENIKEQLDQVRRSNFMPTVFEWSRYPRLETYFPHPLSNVELTRRLVEKNGICLVDIFMKGCLISGLVNVKNFGYKKDVFVRYTLNSWASYEDVPASYLIGNDLHINKFFFCLMVPQDFSVGSDVKFAICYRVNKDEIWDNNLGENYVVVCVENADLSYSKEKE